MQNPSQRMKRLLAAGLLPERAGQPVKARVYISLADLTLLDGSSALLQEWTARVRARWAGHRAGAWAGGGDGGAHGETYPAAARASAAAPPPMGTGRAARQSPGSVEGTDRRARNPVFAFHGSATPAAHDFYCGNTSWFPVRAR